MSRFQIRDDDVVFTHLDDETMILDVKAGVYYNLSGVAPAIFDKIVSGLDSNSILNWMESEFEAPRDDLITDLESWISQMIQFKLIREA